MQTGKFHHTFFVSDSHRENNFFRDGYANWENDTFHILEYYKNHRKGVYIDIGAWIGPTVLYAANIYNQVIAIEPDTVAIKILKDNINLNNYNNITLIEKGLSDNDGKAMFGGNGDLGNSMSSLIIAEKNYELIKGFQENFDHSTIIEIDTITIDTLIKEQNIDPGDISLIKMDIEGGEIIVVPHLINFLQQHKPVFYISLHYVFIKACDLKIIIDILFDIYDKCFIFDSNGNKRLVEKTFVLKNQCTVLVFE